ncbi:sulfatase-like hydrolase/transferase [Nostocoides sp. F2B08]|uniref:LTA synthase family protein n=1 Tax=Nostocoides sp. F2B08 TaxID=2653936 RepID=UPI001262D852|nr:alkaline phosphatase family protein [Tetrasphaera sp. F2B08]KAB7743562.1 sulfatase-like hydrolase/transferase [Tetrasphaera sp. F2B08]
MNDAPSTRREAREAAKRPRRLALPAFLAASIIYLEVLLRIGTDAPFANDGLLYIVLFAVAVALLVHLVAGLFAGRTRTIVVGVFLAVLTVVFASQFIYYEFFTTFYTVFSAMHGGQAAEFAGDVIVALRDNVLRILLLSLPFILFLVLRSRLSAGRRRATLGESGIVAILVVAVSAVALTALDRGDREPAGAYDLYYRTSEPVASVNRLGLLTSMRLDVQRTVLGFEPELAPPPVMVLPAQPSPTRPAESPGEEPVVYADNVMDIDFERLIAEADSDELRTMHQYFATREATAQNEHTGMFEGYNLVFITAEGYSHYAVDRELTPTLYEMTHEGFTFTDFYNPLWGVSTSDGEYVATTSVIPKSGVWSMYKSAANAMPFAMGNQLRQDGYTTFAYHNHTYDYYRRDLSHPNLGYEYKGLGNGLEIPETWPSSDLDMIDVTTADYVGDEPFHAYYMTVSGHMQYNFFGNYIAAKNRDLVEGLPYTEAGRAYLATQIELDRALELLMRRLEEAGVADRTLIVMSADHYPYGLDIDEIDDLAGHEVDRTFELYKSSLIIYAKGMEPAVIDRPASSLDILPTVSNLMGLEFDSRLLMGRDIFSDAEPVVIFANRSFLTDKGRYDSATREFTPAEGVEVPEDYRRRVSEEIDRQFYFSTMILDRDYYATVLDR